MDKNLPKWIQILLVLSVVMAALLVLFNLDRMHVYGTYLREKSPVITTRLLDLSADMGERQLRKHFEGVPLTCIGQSPESNSLGDRVCYTALDKADGDAAMTLAAFFRKGKLSNVMVQMPWWVHESPIARLNVQFGQPSLAGLASRFGGPVLRWTLPNGYVDTNRDRSFNPLEWNLLMWTSDKVEQGTKN